MKRILLMVALFVATQTFAQDNSETYTDLSNFTLCNLTLVDLKKLDNNIALVDVNEMGFCSGNHAFDAGKGYVSKKYPGVVFQKETETERISKLHFTSEFNGKLPNGKEINLNNLTTETVSEMMPNLKMSTAGDCEDFNSLSDDNMRFYFASGEEEVAAITGFDMVAECPPMAAQNPIGNPIFFINNEEASQEQVGKLKPDEIKSFEVISPDDAKKRYGQKGEFGVVLIKTKN